MLEECLLDDLLAIIVKDGCSLLVLKALLVAGLFSVRPHHRLLEGQVQRGLNHLNG